MNYKKTINPTISRDKSVNKRRMTNLHCHDNHELYYLLNGVTKYFVGNETFLLEKGNLIFIPSQVPHSCDSSNESLNNERILLSIPDTFFTEDTRQIFDELNKCKFLSIPSENLHVIDNLFNKISKEYKSNKPHNTLLFRLYVLELLAILCRLKKNDKTTQLKNDSLIQEIADYIHQNFDTQLSLDELSQRFFISKAHLSRQFKLVLGIGLNEYITYVRITNAEKLLLKTNMSITEIAAASGFNDSNYFATVFKKLKGITPYKYSKINFSKNSFL